MDLHQTLFQRRGAVTKVAEHLRISVPAVSQWKKRGIPADRVDAVEKALSLMDGGPVEGQAQKKNIRQKRSRAAFAPQAAE